MWIVAAAVIVLYIAAQNPRVGAAGKTLARPTSAAPPGGNFFATIGGPNTQIAIPGLGSYTNIGGGQSAQISLSPGIWTTIFGAGAAQPNAVTAVPSPVDLGYLPTSQLPADVGTFYL